MFDDFKELLSIFHAHGVKYLIVGGYAVSFHAQPRATKDIELLIKREPVMVDILPRSTALTLTADGESASMA
jgi:hypothetical protein